MLWYRNVHRFLWFEGTPGISDLPAVADYKMTRVTFGIGHLSNCGAQCGSIRNKLKRSFYVGDMVVSEKSVESIIKLWKLHQKLWQSQVLSYVNRIQMIHR